MDNTGAQEYERLHPEEQAAVNALVEHSGLVYGIVTVQIQVKKRRPERVEIATRRDVVGKLGSKQEGRA